MRLLFARNHALHPWTLSICVDVCSRIGAVLIAYDYECEKEQSASLFLGSQKQAFLASWLWALTVLEVRTPVAKAIWGKLF